MTAALRRSPSGITYLERAGAGLPLVFLHGIGSNASSFARLFAHLPSDLHLIAWNAPGYGGSAPLPLDWPQAADYADALAQFLDDLHIGRCILVGHSLGTLMGAAFAARSPARVSQLILAACAQGYGIAVGQPMPDGVAKRIEDLNAQGPDAFAKSRAARLVHAPDDNPDVVALVQANMAQVDPAGYGQAVRMLASGDLAGTLGGIATQTAFLIGAQDQVTPLAQTQQAAKAWGDRTSTAPTIKSIPGAGHAVYVQKPDAFALGLVSLLDPIGAI